MAAVVRRTWPLIQKRKRLGSRGRDSPVDVNAPDLDAGVPLDVGDGAFQRVTVEAIAV
jgi:hypothetical protein